MAIKKNRTHDVEERNNRIEQMGLDELKRYLCMKNYQNPEKCKDCPGNRTCKAGQRAIVLISEREIRKMKIDEGRKNSIEVRRENAKNNFIVAVNQPDMIQYLIEHDGNSRNAAREKLKNWGRMFPEIAEQYNFWEKLNKLTIGKTPDGRNKQTVEAIERYKEASEQDDPIAFMMEKYGIDRGKAIHNFGQWKRRYGEIKKEEPEVKENEEDEVSVEDFLKDFHAFKFSDEQKPTITLMQKENDFSGELNAKYYELEKEREELKARIAWINQAMDALVMTAKVFNPNTTLGSANEQEHHAG